MKIFQNPLILLSFLITLKRNTKLKIFHCPYIPPHKPPCRRTSGGGGEDGERKGAIDECVFSEIANFRQLG